MIGRKHIEKAEQGMEGNYHGLVPHRGREDKIFDIGLHRRKEGNMKKSRNKGWSSHGLVPQRGREGRAGNWSLVLKRGREGRTGEGPRGSKTRKGRVLQLN